MISVLLLCVQFSSSSHTPEVLGTFKIANNFLLTHWNSHKNFELFYCRWQVSTTTAVKKFSLLLVKYLENLTQVKNFEIALFRDSMHKSILTTVFNSHTSLEQIHRVVLPKFIRNFIVFDSLRLFKKHTKFFTWKGEVRLFVQRKKNLLQNFEFYWEPEGLFILVSDQPYWTTNKTWFKISKFYFNNPPCQFCDRKITCYVTVQHCFPKNLGPEAWP